MATYSPTTHHLPEPPLTAMFTPIRRFRDQVICIRLIDSLLLAHQSIEVGRSSFATYLSSLDLGWQRLLGNLAQQGIDKEFWISALQAGTVEVVSDGSVKGGSGTYAVVFKSGKKLLWFQGPVDCHPQLLQSYQ
eukprot:14607648-Ditylum_brightwellii.AAC.1